jgi:hypothetical protein
MHVMSVNHAALQLSTKHSETTQETWANTAIHIVTCFKSHVSEAAFPVQRIWNLVGNRLVEAHIRGNERTPKTGALEADVSGVQFCWRLSKVRLDYWQLKLHAKDSSRRVTVSAS